MKFFNYIKAVGTGPKSNRELSPSEVEDAIELILTQQVPTEQISAFLLGWRVRLETNEELKATLKTCNKYVKTQEIKNSLELGYAFDGKSESPYLLPIVSKYLKKFNLNLIVSGDELQPAKKGITIKQLHNNIDFGDNVYYFDRAKYFKELSDLTKLRNILGLRTAFNTVEKLLNPAKSEFAINSAFHRPYVEKYFNLFNDRYKNLLIVKGNEGSPEIFKKAKYWICKDGVIKENIVDPEYFGIKYKKNGKKISLEESLNMIKDPSDDLERLAKLNAAIYLIAAQKATNINEAFEMIE
ncbi:MAG: glycosyl transferase [Arcobacter sp.]|nr:glycosyl transferase [Arcobacter sp.]